MSLERAAYISLNLKVGLIDAMMINLSNHSVSGWSNTQRVTAEQAFEAVIDLPFPAIAPDAGAEELVVLGAGLVQQCKALLDGQKPPHAIHVMGEMTFTFVLVRLLQQEGFYCVASTSHRHVEQIAPQEKKTLFKFVQFRAYPSM